MSIQSDKTVGEFALTPATQCTLNVANLMAEAKAANVPEPIIFGDAELTQEQALEIQSELALKLLATDGVKILNEMYLATAELIKSVMWFVIPVMQETETLQLKLGEAFPSFEASFNELREDLANITLVANGTYKKHANLELPLDEAKIEMLSNCALAYSKLQTQLENQISPELMRLIAVMEEAGVGADALSAALASAFIENNEVEDV